VAILVFTVTLASSAFDAKLQKSSVVEMRQILKDKQKERDSLMTKVSLKNLEHMRQMKLSDEQSTLMKMRAEEEAAGAADGSADKEEASGAAAAGAAVKMEQMEDKLMSCKAEDDDEKDEDEGYKRYLMEECGLEGAELEEEWLAWRAAHPSKFIGSSAPQMQAKPKSKLLRLGGPMKRPSSAAHPKAKPAAKMRGSVLAACTAGQGLNIVFRMSFYNL
jgi:hypothetical protein